MSAKKKKPPLKKKTLTEFDEEEHEPVSDGLALRAPPSGRTETHGALKQRPLLLLHKIAGRARLELGHGGLFRRHGKKPKDLLIRRGFPPPPANHGGDGEDSDAEEDEAAEP